MQSNVFKNQIIVNMNEGKIKGSEMSIINDEKDTNFKALKLIGNVIRNLNLGSQFRSRSTYFYHKITKIKIPKAKNYVLLVALSLFFTFNDQKENDSSLQEIVNIFHSIGHEINADELNQLSLTIQPKLKQIFKYLGCRSEDYLPQIISEVIKRDDFEGNLKKNGIDAISYEKELKTQANSILKSYDIKKRGDADPYFLATTITYAADQSISYNQKIQPVITQEMLTQVTNCSEKDIQTYWKKYLYPHVNVVRMLSNLKLEQERRFEIGMFQNKSSLQSKDWNERMNEEKEKLDSLKKHFSELGTGVGLVEARFDPLNSRIVFCTINLRPKSDATPKYINFLIRMPLRYPYRPPKASDFSKEDFIQKHHDFKRWEKDDPEFINFRFACLGDLEKRWENDGSMGVAHYIQMLFYYAAFDHFSIIL